MAGYKGRYVFYEFFFLTSYKLGELKYTKFGSSI